MVGLIQRCTVSINLMGWKISTQDNVLTMYFVKEIPLNVMKKTLSDSVSIAFIFIFVVFLDLFAQLHFLCDDVCFSLGGVVSLDKLIGVPQVCKLVHTKKICLSLQFPVMCFAWATTYTETGKTF